MKLKEAIARLRNDIKGGTVWRGNRGVDFEFMLSELRASQKRERDMWKALSWNCRFQLITLEHCSFKGANFGKKCQRSTCPLLKARAK